MTVHKAWEEEHGALLCSLPKQEEGRSGGVGMRTDGMGSVPGHGPRRLTVPPSMSLGKESLCARSCPNGATAIGQHCPRMVLPKEAQCFSHPQPPPAPVPEAV